MKKNAFKDSLTIIDTYYNSLADLAVNNKRLNSINECIFDNHYILNEFSRTVISDLSGKMFRSLGESRKKLIDDLIVSYYEQNEYTLNLVDFHEKLIEYQTKNEDFFSYTEISYIFTLLLAEPVEKLGGYIRLFAENLLIREKLDQMFLDLYENIENLDDYELNYFLDNRFFGTDYFIEQLSYKIRDLGNKGNRLLSDLGVYLSGIGKNLNDIVSAEQSRYTSDALLVSHIFKVLKMLSEKHIDDFYEAISFTEQKLLSEKAGIYKDMSDKTKASYREQIIRKIKKSGGNELEYVSSLVEEADFKNEHTGFLLFPNKQNKTNERSYIFFITFFTVFITLVLFVELGTAAAFLLIIPISQIVIEFANQITLYFVRARTMPRLKFTDGLPDDCSAMAVITSIANDPDKLAAMFEKLEIYYLANKTKNLYFLFLADCSAEKSETVPHDEEVAKAGLAAVSRLNKKYGKKFYFLYRNRFYNTGEQSYIGYERKRGALNHLNTLLLGKMQLDDRKKWFRADSFDEIPYVKYVITLDADTKLLLDTATELVAAIAHPLNRPVLSPDKNKVISGYGVMQPRVTIDVEVTDKSFYSQLFAGFGGLDTYSFAEGNIYQDLFGEGSYTGKGIYDLEVFDTVLSGRFPNNQILSHDLLEGNYIRCGFINDLDLYDDYPSKFLNDKIRQHRWVRGDWQIMPWLLNRTRNEKNKKEPNPIGTIGKYKIFDNLRRSLVPIFTFLILVYGFSLTGNEVNIFIITALIILFIPALCHFLAKVLYRKKTSKFLKYYVSVLKGAFASLYKTVILFATMPFDAFMNADAIIRSLFRMFVSRKNLLNWVTADEVERTKKNTFPSYLKAFIVNFAAIAVVVFLYIIFGGESYGIYPVTILWGFAPLIMYFFSRDLDHSKKSLGEKELTDINSLAYGTWKYYEDLLTENNHYLIPDNYQENRQVKSDFRTSPTDIAYSFTSVVAAYELEYIDKAKAIDFIDRILTAVEKLEKWHGHLYNWYNIKTLEKMWPYFISTVDSGNLVAALYVIRSLVTDAGEKALIDRIDVLIEQADFKKLYKEDRHLFCLGYDGIRQDYNLSFYEYFASESRLTSFVAIAKGDVPAEHWFAADKSLIRYKRYKGLVSWFGSLFEYFMPLAFQKTYRNTLLDESYFFAVYAQKDFIKKASKKMPWGISESSYNYLDDAKNYKYGSFGVPFLKFKSIGKYPLVISPYSSIMALPLYDKDVYTNIKKLKRLDMTGTYGFYDAYDGDDETPVKVYYAHHQGMILAGFANYLSENIIQKHFHNNHAIKANEILLKEKVQLNPLISVKSAKYRKPEYQKVQIQRDRYDIDGVYNTTQVGIVSSEDYTILMDDKGNGFSKYKSIQISRYRRIHEEPFGIFLYIKNLKDGNVWSNTYSPINYTPNMYNVAFASDRLKYTREDHGIITVTEVIPLNDALGEIRKITLVNRSDQEVNLELTSYSELILARNEDDIAHRAFNSLTIESDYDHSLKALVFRKKSRGESDSECYLGHKIYFPFEMKESIPEYETSRVKFIGRCKGLANPEAVFSDNSLSCTTGYTLDPIMSIRKKLILGPDERANAYMLVAFGKSRQQIADTIGKFSNQKTIDREFELISALSNTRNSHSELSGLQMSSYTRLIKNMYVAAPNSDARKEILKNNKLFQNTLWKFGISGDLPIIYLHLDSIDNSNAIRNLMQFFEFCKSKGIGADLAITHDCEDEESLFQYINYRKDQIYRMNSFWDVPGQIYAIRKNDITSEEKDLIHLVSSVYLNTATKKSLEEKYHEDYNKETFKEYLPYMKNLPLADKPDLEFDNGTGGFSKDGREYVIYGETPVSWFNVLANERFGAVISNDMTGFTYAFNSREYKLTSWTNDVTASCISEKIIINNRIFVPSITRHGFGYSRFTAVTDTFDADLLVFVAKDSNVKFFRLDIKNNTDDLLELNLDLKLMMVLGVNEDFTGKYLVAEENEGYVKIRNPYNRIFSEAAAFVFSTEKTIRFCDDLIAKTFRVNSSVEVKGTASLAFALGADTEDQIPLIVKRFKSLKKIDSEFDDVRDYWDHKLNAIRVDTPDPSFNFMVNGWYLYQTYAARMFARSGFYQVGGAFGFRDQLQDSMSFLYSEPERTRNQILKHAAHQFKEGDVLHWWHEELKVGSRTKFADDYLWMIYVTYEYIMVTGDTDILDEQVGFVDGEKLGDGQDEMGIVYTEIIDEKISLFEHLKLSVKKTLGQLGAHDLPLIGSGDWNDGMNKIGVKGKGESVWMGFFLYDLLLKMKELAKTKDPDLSILCEKQAKILKTSINNNAWDGMWYIRAYFDNGAVLGSHDNDECQIDLICQSWGVLTDVASKERKLTAISSAEARLVDRENKYIRLLTPPFAHPKDNPGYIAGYPPGVRENGGQYTHAAFWYIMALLKEEYCNLAYEYFSMINPVNRALDQNGMNTYMVEPYVLSADIYSNPEYPGRGGWSWYTGSSGWAYKVAVEHIMGMKKTEDTLSFSPKTDSGWDRFSMKYLYLDTEYDIRFYRSAKASVKLDGRPVKDKIKLENDGKPHKIEVFFTGH